MQLLDCRIEAHVDRPRVGHPLLVNRPGGQLRAPLKDDHRSHIAGKRERFLQRRITTAHDADRLAAEEWSVAGGTVAQATSEEQLLADETQRCRLGADGDDHRPGLVALVVRPDRPARPGRSDAGDLGQGEVGAGAGCLLLRIGSELVAGDTFRKSGKVLDRGHVGQMPAGHARLDHERGVSATGGEQAGGQAGQSATDDDDVVVRRLTSSRRPTPSVRSWRRKSASSRSSHRQPLPPGWRPSRTCGRSRPVHT